MGLFDFRCHVSGLSLRASPAALIPVLEHTPGRWLPLVWPLIGRYDRGGSIDGLLPDFRTDLFVAGFNHLLRADRIDARGEPGELASFKRRPTVETLLHLFERVNTMSQFGAVPFTLDGNQLRQLLLHADVFAAIAPAAAPTAPPTYEQLEQQLADAPLAPQGRELLQEVIIAGDDVRGRASLALAQLTALARWLDAHGKDWTPRNDSGQYFAEQDLQFARAARRDLSGVHELQPVFDRVVTRLEREVEQ